MRASGVYAKRPSAKAGRMLNMNRCESPIYQRIIATCVAGTFQATRTHIARTFSTDCKSAVPKSRVCNMDNYWQKEKRSDAMSDLEFMVVATGFEPVTPAV